MRTFTVRSLIAVTIAVFGISLAPAQTPTTASMVAEGAQVRQLADGFVFTEGPAVAPNGDVYFSDNRDNKVYRWDVREEKLSVYMPDSGDVNGIDFGPDGRMYICQMRERRIAVVDMATSTVTGIVDRYGGGRFNDTNDLWVSPTGAIYFTDPAYELRRGQQSEVGGRFVYFIPAGASEAKRVEGDYVRPNGIVGTADGRLLYVADIEANVTYDYDLADDGTPTNRRPFVRLGSDGMTLDSAGNLYLTPPGVRGVTVVSPEGEQIGTIPFPGCPANVVFGGVDRDILFVTARDKLISLQMQVRGQE